MFFYFNHKRARYDRGQVAPFFILIIVIIIIMAMVTVNLSKVSSVKTDTANAADSGALAAGSVMANTFNLIAQSNDELQVGYFEMILTVAPLYTFASIAIVMAGLTAPIGADIAIEAIPYAYPIPFLAAIYSLVAATTDVVKNSAYTFYMSMIYSIISTLLGFTMNQYYTYKSLRDLASNGRDSAQLTAYRFAFLNSGIGTKLKDGSPPSGVTDERKHNYRKGFSQWMQEFDKNIKSFSPNKDDQSTWPEYRWVDGQNRTHYVRAYVDIDPVDDFVAMTTIMPFYAEESLLLMFSNIIFTLSYSTAFVDFLGASAAQMVCLTPCILCWLACPVWIALSTVGLGLLLLGIASDYALTTCCYAVVLALALSLSGLAPGVIKHNPSMADIICWITDIKHNHKVRVDVVQHHDQGTDLGLWQMRYPDTVKSFAEASFAGKGSIYKPNPSFDASLIKTDVTSFDDCPGYNSNICDLESEAKGLRDEADNDDLRLADLKERIATLSDPSVSTDSNVIKTLKKLEKMKNNLIQSAKDKRSDADGLDADAEKARSAHPECSFTACN